MSTAVAESPASVEETTDLRELSLSGPEGRNKVLAMAKEEKVALNAAKKAGEEAPATPALDALAVITAEGTKRTKKTTTKKGGKTGKARQTGLQDRVLAHLTTSGPIDDDALATALNVTPRQSVNIVCRRLVEQGKVVRAKGGEQNKILNRLTGTPAPKAVPVKKAAKKAVAAKGGTTPRRANGTIAPKPKKAPGTSSLGSLIRTGIAAGNASAKAAGERMVTPRPKKG